MKPLPIYIPNFCHFRLVIIFITFGFLVYISPCMSASFPLEKWIAFTTFLIPTYSWFMDYRVFN